MSNIQHLIPLKEITRIIRPVYYTIRGVIEGPHCRFREFSGLNLDQQKKN